MFIKSFDNYVVWLSKVVIFVSYEASKFKDGNCGV